MEGAKAPSILDEVWVPGGDDISLAQSSREGSAPCALTHRAQLHQFINASRVTGIETECFLV